MQISHIFRVTRYATSRTTTFVHAPNAALAVDFMRDKMDLESLRHEESIEYESEIVEEAPPAPLRIYRDNIEDAEDD